MCYKLGYCYHNSLTFNFISRNHSHILWTKLFFNCILTIISTYVISKLMLAYKEGIARKLIAKNLMWWGFLSNLLWEVFFVGSVIYFKNLGSLGLSLSYVISYGVSTIIFVPFYISRKVIPRDLIISKEVLLIWTVLIIQAIITLLEISILIRFVTLLISIGILIFLFNRIWSLI